jgi:SAM-dependent methyltransferase
VDAGHDERGRQIRTGLLTRGARRLARPARRLARPRGPDLDAELAWWLEEWDPVIRAGGFNPGDVPAFIPGEDVADTYEGRRWQIARAEVRRVAAEAGMDEAELFGDRVVVDVGPGPLGFPDACPARVAIGVEPLAERYRAHGLLLDSDAVYLTVSAEAMPLLGQSVDVVVSRNSLDHVTSPRAAVDEVRRVLRPGGTFLLSVDVDHPATPTEPHTLELDGVRALLEPFEIVREEVRDEAHGGGGGRRVVVLARAPGSALSSR